MGPICSYFLTLLALVMSETCLAGDSLHSNLNVPYTAAVGSEKNVLSLQEVKSYFKEEFQNLKEEIKKRKEEHTESDGGFPWQSYTGWFVAILTIVVTYKQTKGSSVSNFRVKWIEDLRVAYSKYYMALQNVCHKMKAKKLNAYEDVDLNKLRFYEAKIKLLLNHQNEPAIKNWRGKVIDFFSQKDNDYEHQEFWTKLLMYSESSQSYSVISASLISFLKQEAVTLKTLISTEFS